MDPSLQDDISRIGINWKLSLQSFQPDGKITSGQTSFYTSSQRSYLTKLLTNRLPTASRKKLYNNQYPDDKCLYCNSSVTSKHLFKCPQSKGIITDIFLKLLQQIPESLNKEEIIKSLRLANGSSAKIHNNSIIPSI